VSLIGDVDRVMVGRAVYAVGVDELPSRILIMEVVDGHLAGGLLQTGAALQSGGFPI
jgi:hypothetical protein